MKLSWKNFKISIAGAKLSHLVLKDNAWDPGSMTEQARVIFSLVQKANNSSNIDSLKKYLTAPCFLVLHKELETLKRDNRTWKVTDWEIIEIAILEVHPGKGKRPNEFVAYIKVFLKDDVLKPVVQHLPDFSYTLLWTFENHGGWWMLSEMKGRGYPEQNLIK
ncbi:MAG TPA: hypothetical protein VFZ42_14455 [Chitinophagaceae bacterium]